MIKLEDAFNKKVGERIQEAREKKQEVMTAEKPEPQIFRPSNDKTNENVNIPVPEWQQKDNVNENGNENTTADAEGTAAMPTPSIEAMRAAKKPNPVQEASSSLEKIEKLTPWGNDDAIRIIAKDMDGDVSRITKNIASGAVKIADEQADKVMEAGREKEKSLQGALLNAGAPVQSVAGAGIAEGVQTSRNYWRELTPEAVNKHVEQALRNTSYLDIQQAAEKAGVDTDWYINNVIATQLQKEIYNQLLEKHVPESTMEYIGSGVFNSLIGQLGEMVYMPAEVRQMRTAGRQIAGEREAWWANMGNMAVGFAADLPVFKGLGSAISKLGVNQAVGAGMNFYGYSFLSGVTGAAHQTGEITPTDIWNAHKEGVKGFVTGAAMVPANKFMSKRAYMQRVANWSQKNGVNMATKAATFGNTLATNTAVMGTADMLMSGNPIENITEGKNWAEMYGHALMMNVVMDMQHLAEAKVGGAKPYDAKEFTEQDIQHLRDAGIPVKNSKQLYQWLTQAGQKVYENQQGMKFELGRYAEDILNNKRLTLEEKNKVARMITGHDAVQMNPSVDTSVKTIGENQFAVYEMDALGTYNKRRVFGTMEEAKQYEASLQPEILRNKVEQVDAIADARQESLAMIEGIKAVAELTGQDANDLARVIMRNGVGEELTAEEQKMRDMVFEYRDTYRKYATSAKEEAMRAVELANGMEEGTMERILSDGTKLSEGERKAVGDYISDMENRLRKEKEAEMPISEDTQRLLDTEKSQQRGVQIYDSGDLNECRHQRALTEAAAERLISNRKLGERFVQQLDKDGLRAVEQMKRTVELTPDEEYQISDYLNQKETMEAMLNQMDAKYKVKQDMARETLKTMFPHVDEEGNSVIRLVGDNGKVYVILRQEGDSMTVSPVELNEDGTVNWQSFNGDVRKAIDWEPRMRFQEVEGAEVLKALMPEYVAEYNAIFGERAPEAGMELAIPTESGKMERVKLMGQDADGNWMAAGEAGEYTLADADVRRMIADTEKAAVDVEKYNAYKQAVEQRKREIENSLTPTLSKGEGEKITAADATGTATEPATKVDGTERMWSRDGYVKDAEGNEGRAAVDKTADKMVADAEGDAGLALQAVRNKQGKLHSEIEEVRKSYEKETETAKLLEGQKRFNELNDELGYWNQVEAYYAYKEADAKEPQLITKQRVGLMQKLADKMGTRLYVTPNMYATMQRLYALNGKGFSEDRPTERDAELTNGFNYKGDIYVNGETVRGLLFAFGHESGHSVKSVSEDGYEAYKQAIKDAMGEEAWNAAKDAKRKVDVYRNLADDKLEEEVVADQIGELLQDPNKFDIFVKRLVDGKAKTAINALGDAIKKFADNMSLEGLKEVGADLKKEWETINYEFKGAEKLLADAYKKAFEAAKPKDPQIRMSRENDEIFYSNARKAVEDIKQEKATPEQWLNMIQKNGGLKAGEDKWMGLSEWLKNQDAKTLTKEEVMNFVRDNSIQIEEVHYGGNVDINKNKKWQEFNEEFGKVYEEIRANRSSLEEELDNFEDKMYDKYGRGWYNELSDEEIDYMERFDKLDSTEGTTDEKAFRKMVERYGDDFEQAFEVDAGGNLKPTYDYDGSLSDAAKYFLDIDERTINDTRLNYTTEGLENNREIALVVPTIESWNKNDKIHFGDAGEGRAIAWARFGETTDTDGNRVNVIDEIQSKRHQEGREKGYKYKDAKEPKERYKETLEAFQEFQREQRRKYGENTIPAQWPQEVRDEFDRLRDENSAAYDDMRNEKGSIPDAPFDKNWHELAMKRMLRYAAENGYDKLAWTTGAQQAERYDIGNTANSVLASDWADFSHFAENANDCKMISIYNNDNAIIEALVNREGRIIKTPNTGLVDKNLSEVVGKELSIKLLSDGLQKLEGEKLRIGGEGMKAFYDRMIPSFMNKYCKKWGTQVHEVELPELEVSARKMWAVDITPEMRESVMHGQPMFSKEGEIGQRRLVEAGMDEDNLNIAKEMREAGKTVDVIKLATGWEIGRDGKWRKEAEDLAFTEEAWDTFFKKPVGAEFLLSDVMEFSKLYVAYPKLLDTKLITYFGGGGAFDEETNTIKIGTMELAAGMENAREVIAHEVQHFIQAEEGFAKGGNPRQPIETLMNKEEKAAYKDVLKTINRIEGDTSELLEQREYLLDMSWRKSEYDLLPDFLASEDKKWQPTIWNIKELNREIDEIKKELKTAREKRDEILRAVAERNGIEYKGVGTVIGTDGYERLAGEVEARSVQRRINMTPENRRKVLTRVDEDVPPQEQIIYFSKEKDPETLEKLNKEKTVKVYRAIRMDEDGTLNSPMAGGGVGGKRKGERVETYKPKFGEWEKADEHPELATMNEGDEYGHITIDKGQGNGTLEVAYNPYIHTSRQMLNDQFSSAWRRPDLQVMEVEIPESELTSGYRADMAKNAVGETEWTDGVVAKQLPAEKRRKVILSRWDKPVRIVPAEEYAKSIAEQLEGTGIKGIPFNCVTPEQREALRKAGVQILEPEKKAGAEAMKAYEEWMNQQTESAGTVTIQGLDGYTEKDVLDMVRGDIKEILDEAGVDVKLKGMALHGSRMRGDAKEKSDLDVVVEYDGDISEDGLYNILNENPITIEGVKVDINPITKYKSGTLEQYMERSRKYDEEVAAAKRKPAENGVQFSKEEEERVYRKPLSKTETRDIITKMEQSAVLDPQITLTPESWLKTFGINNSLKTPVGNVKMGESQYQKFFDKKRSGEFGMAVSTLQEPDVIFKEPSQAKEGQETERPHSYVFVKTFDRNGEKIKYYTSVTVQKDNMEVSISSHYMNPARVKERFMTLERIYTKDTLLPNSSEMHLAEQQKAVPDLLPTQRNNVSFDGKGKENVGNVQENGEKFSKEAATKPKDGENFLDYAKRVMVEERTGVDTNPSEAQKEAGNYKKGHIRLDGYDITIENPKGSTRSGKDADGKEWSVKMNYDYGYIRGTKGVDGDHIDVYLGPDQENGRVYVVDQIDQKTGKFDEHKVMYGFRDAEAAKEAYLSQYEDGWKMGAMTPVSKEEFKKWVDSSTRKTKPFGEYKAFMDRDAIDGNMNETTADAVGTTAERDAAYLKAVENGDMTKAKELFDEVLREKIGTGVTPYLAAGRYFVNRNKAHSIKGRDPKVIAEIADKMAPMIPKDAVLVPAPGHTGEATDMLDLAKALSERTGVPVADVLKSEPRDSQYESKRTGKPLTAEQLGITMKGELPEGKLPVVIDNVVDSGNTAEACVKALGKGVVASFTDSVEKRKHVLSLKSAEPVTYDDQGKVIPLSERFNLEKRDVRFSKEIDGRQMVMQSLLDEALPTTKVDGTERRETTADAEGTTATDLSELRLRPLEEGETCRVQRRYEEAKQFSFTSGKEKVESMDDVAYIFKQLEDKAVENAFMCLVKDGKPYVVHMAMGGYTTTSVDLRTSMAAFQSVKPDMVYLIHNHPSGKLTASREDRMLLDKLMDIYGKNVVKPGIIIDTTSGKYGVFDNMYYGEEKSMPNAEGTDIPVKTYSFSKMVFDKSWNPDEEFSVKSSEAIAKFVSSHRLGDRKKMSLLVVDNHLNMTGNFFLPYVDMDGLYDKKDAKAVARELSDYVNLAGGTAAVLYGNYECRPEDVEKMKPLRKAMDLMNIKLLDVMHFDEEKMYNSAAENGLMFSKENDDKKIVDAAVKHFGVTNDIREAGYVLADGRMLDFSGRHLLNPGEDSSFLKGGRTSDHRTISEIEYAYEANGEEIETGLKTSMPEFIRMGNIRIDNNAGSINLSFRPTKEQKEVLRRLIAKNDGDVQVDFGDGWESDHYVEYEGATPARVLADIDKYFTDGIKPEGNVRFSKEDTKDEKFKKWFGDWEKEPEKASKVVDENGEPLVVYKRAYEKKNVFEGEWGTFFSDEPLKDKGFGNYVGKYYLDIKNPLVLDAEGTSWSYPLWRFVQVGDEEMPATKEEFDNIVRERNLLRMAPKEIWDIVWEDDGELDFEDADYMIKEYGLPYDGVIIKDIAEGTSADQYLTDYIVLEPTQIKSATENNGEYDANNPDIRFSKEGSSKEWKQAKEKYKEYPFALDVLRNLEPQDINDIAAGVLAGGNMLWEGKEKGEFKKKGVKEMMGWKEGERKNFLGMFAKDGMTFAQAGEAVEQACRDAHIPFDENDPNAGVNALQDVLGGARSMGELNNYVELRRVDEARELVEETMNRMADERNEYYQKNYGMSYDEYMTYQEESAKAQAGSGISEDAERQINWLKTRNERQQTELARITKEIDRLKSEELARPLVITQGKIIEQQQAQLNQTKTELNELKDATKRKKNYENAYRELLAVKHDVATFVKEQLAAEDMPFTSKKELNKILATVEKTNTAEQLEDALREVQMVTGKSRIKHMEYQLDKLLKLKIQGLNGKNMSVAKTVDDRTRRIIEDIRGRVQDIGISGMEEQLDELLRQRREQRGAINELQVKLKDADDTDKLTIQKKIDDGEQRWKELSEQIQAKADEISEARESKRKLSEEDLTKEINAIMEKADQLAQEGKQLPEDEADKISALEGFKIIQQSRKSASDVYQIDKDIRGLWQEIYDLREQREGVQDEQERKRLNRLIINRKEKIKANEQLLVDAQEQQAYDIQESINMLESLMDEGRNNLKQCVDAQLLRRHEMIRNACNAIRNEKNKVDYNTGEKNTKNNPAWKVPVNANSGNFEYMCQRLDQTGKAGADGWIYRQFVSGKEGVMEAYNTYQRGLREQKDQLNAKVTEIFGTENSRLLNTDAWVRQAMKSDKVDAKCGVTMHDEEGRRFDIPLSKGQATYLYMVWKMEDGRSKMLVQGFDNQSMQEIEDFIGPKYKQLADWIQDDFLTTTRAKYNERYRELYNTSMAKIKNYVPIRVNKDATRQESDLSEDKNRKMTLEQRAGSLINRTVNVKPIDITKSMFDVISEHIEQMENWYAYSPVRRDLDAILSNTYFRNQVDANNAGYFKRFYDAAAVATQSYAAPPTEHSDRLLAMLNKGLLSGNIAWRLSTAIKQLYSASAYMGYTYDPRYELYLAKNIGTAMIGKNIKWCMDNIPSFRARVDVGDIGNVRLSEKVGDTNSKAGKWVENALKTYSSIGMIPNRMIDAFTCSIGAKSIYDYKLRQLKLEIERDKGLTPEMREEALKEAHRKAVMEADLFYNSTQQSSNPMFLSPMQVSRSIVDRAFSAYQNNNLGYVRKTFEAAYDLIRSAQYKKMVEAYQKSYMEDGMPVEQAAQEAKMMVLKNSAKSLIGLFVMGWLNKMLWDKGSQGFFGFGSDEITDSNEQQPNETDEQYAARTEWNQWLNYLGYGARPIQGTPLGNYLKSVSEKRTFNPLLVLDEVSDLQKDMTKLMQKDGVFNKQLMWMITNHALRSGGINLETLGNIYYGAEQMAIDGGDVNDKFVDLMFMLNTPNKGRVDVAKNLYKDEDFVQYAQDVAKADKYLTKGTAISNHFPWMKDWDTKKNGKEMKKEYDKLKKEWEQYHGIDFSKPASVSAETTKIYQEDSKWDDIAEDGLIANTLREVEPINKEWKRLATEDKNSPYVTSYADDYLDINGKEIAKYRLIQQYKKKFNAIKNKLDGSTQDEVLMDKIRDLRTKFLKDINNEKFLQKYVDEELR